MRPIRPLLALAAIAAGSPAIASEELQSRIETLSQDAARISKALDDSARDAGAVERDLAALTAKLSDIAAEEAAARADLAQRRAKLRGVLGALAALSRAPEPALLAHPDAPLAAARAAALMERIGPALIREAKGVEDAVDQIAKLRANSEAAQQSLRASAVELSRLRAGLEAELAARRDDLARAESDAGAAALKAEALARTLNAATAFEAALDQAIASEDARISASPFAEARGALTPPLTPVSLSAGFGDAPSGARPGAPREGLWLRGAAHGAVIAPWSGRILYAAPFRKLRNVIILEPETDYLVVLGGLATLSHKVGDYVKAGEILGRLDGPEVKTEEFLIELTNSAGDEVNFARGIETGPDAAGMMLYMEVRVNGTPTDPAPWLRANEKVSGL